jgi:hypothetical protein
LTFWQGSKGLCFSPQFSHESFRIAIVDNKFNILQFLETERCERLVLEFSLEAYNSPSEQTCWRNAIEDLVSRLSASKSNSAKYALELYRHYQNNYTENQLFRYSIKALGCNAVDTVAVLQDLGGAFRGENIRRKMNPIFTFSHNEPNFTSSLEATQNVQVSQGIKWNGWEKVTGKKLEQKLIKETVKSGGLLSSLDDGSLSFPILPSNPKEFNRSPNTNHALPGSSESISDPDVSALVLGRSAALSRIFEVQIPKVEHLKPLHHITMYQEVSGFFQIFSPVASEPQTRFPGLSATEVFTKHRHLVTKDTYIVGLDDHGNPIISSWAEIPHRLIAGLPGAGKTNFLNWIIFQFLYVNPRRKVYISDFGGVDFQHLTRIALNVEVITDTKDCLTLVDKFHQEEYEGRLKLMQEHGVSDLNLLKNEGVDIDRTLWVIDEAADIADESYKVKEAIEKRLKEYARKGRKYGIHVLYCTQRPTTEVVTKQVTDQCEEKVVFRVTPDASQRILDDTVAGSIPKDARGRAWLDGHAGRMFVNVPKITKPEGKDILVEDTLWHHLVAKQ